MLARRCWKPGLSVLIGAAIALGASRAMPRFIAWAAPGEQAITVGAARRLASAGTQATVQGVIYELTLARSEKGQPMHGFYLQDAAARADNDPKTSDGIWVFLGRYPTLKGGYTPKSGDEVVIEGKVTRYYGQTQITSPRLVNTLRSGIDLNAEVPAVDAAPPDDLEAARAWWESHEGMRVRLSGGCIALGPTVSYGGTQDADLWVARPDTAIARREDAYSRRAFRDAHPLDNIADQVFDDGNGYRIALGSAGLKGANGDAGAVLASVRTFDRITTAPTGGVGYRFGKYIVDVTHQITCERGADPALNAPPVAPKAAAQYTVATYNVENLYDYRDDPSDPCDFEGNPGRPGVEPPFDYVPHGEAEYRHHLDRLARNIVTDLHNPDVVMLQEVEDQDICKVIDGKLVAGGNNADGKPDAAQELALAIRGLGGPAYDAAFDRDGTDTRGIICAFLYRTDRVRLAAPSETDPLLGKNPQPPGTWKPSPYNAQVQNPKALNAEIDAAADEAGGDKTDGPHTIFPRAPQVALFHIAPAGATDAGVDLYLIDNHFSSGPDKRIEQRRTQAAWSSALLATAATNNPGVRAIAGGDFNVFPRPDDPIAPTRKKVVSDQLGHFYKRGFFNLFDVLVQQVPASAYTYVHDGMAQTLDQMFNTPTSYSALATVRVAHINSDWPEDNSPTAPPRRASDHDPVVATFNFAPKPVGDTAH